MLLTSGWSALFQVRVNVKMSIFIPAEMHTYHARTFHFIHHHHAKISLEALKKKNPCEFAKKKWMIVGLRRGIMLKRLRMSRRRSH